MKEERKPIASYIDHTLLKADATMGDITRIAGEAASYGFASVCVNPCWVPLCRKLLDGTGV